MAETKVFGVTINTDALNNIPDTYKYVAGGVVSALILFGGLYYFSYPVYTEYQTLLEQNDTMEQDNTNKEQKLGFVPPNRYKSIEKIEEEKKVLNAEIDKLKERIPVKEEIPSLIYDLENMVEIKNKSDLLSITPAGMATVTLPAHLQSSKPTGLNLNQVPLTMSMESDYPSLIALFKDFERYQRAVASGNVSLSPIDSSGIKFNALKVDISLKAYVLPEGGQ